MRQREEVTFFNMCMIYDEKGNVVVQDRVDKVWGGKTFPGGHVEFGESFTESVIREIKEETGLTIQSPQLCGTKNWLDERGRCVVFCYKCNQFSGELVSSSEGEVSWMTIEELLKSNFASGMDKMVRVFIEDEISEFYFLRENGNYKEIII